jgi:uncharacterized protein YbjT (DUF2867 family)
MTSQQTILVAGVTGQQGGAVARRLLTAGFAIRGLTRDPEAEKARRLRELGVELVRGDTRHPDSVHAAFAGVDGAFAMATPFEAGTDDEVAQGKGFGDAAKKAGVRYYVYSSVGGAERDSGIPHFETKWRIEQHLRSLDLPLTVFRPVWFFENFGTYSTQPVEDGYAIMAPLSPDRPLQGVAVEDIAAFVAKAFSDPDRWIGRKVELAGDERTMPQYAEAISRVTGVRVVYQQLPWEAVRAQNEDLAKTFDWFERAGYEADIARLRELHPGLKTFEQWLAEGKLDHLGKAA